MFESIPPLHILLTKGPFVFALDFGRYLVAASITFAIVWLMRQTSLRSRKIQKREASAADIRRELLQSLQSALVYTVGAAFLVWGKQNGGFYDFFQKSFGWTRDLILVASIIAAHDTYFYWVHRAMHHPVLFKHFHHAHHRSVTPSPWAAYSFAVPEAFVMFLFVPLWQFFVPTPGWVFFVWINFQIIRNAMGHAGVELMPRWWLSTPLTSWINTTTHHDLHHNGGFNKNYGLYFTWWDRVMGTEHRDYHARFAKIVARPEPVNTGDVAPAA
jgi:Delta7-sterol 5-desaturase